MKQLTRVLHWSVPKAGSTERECEDAFDIEYENTLGFQPLCIAVADGASESFLSGQWAGILTKSFCRHQKSNSNKEAANLLHHPKTNGTYFASAAGQFLPRAYEDWRKWQEHYLRQRTRQNKPVQWYEEAGLAAGGFAAMLGLTLQRHRENSLRWQAMAVGDVCFFQVRRKRELVLSFPVCNTQGFTNRPVLISAKPAGNAGLEDSIHLAQGLFTDDDVLYVATDALAAWFLKQYEDGAKPWQVLERFCLPSPCPTFLQWVRQLRENKGMRNDDVTLLRIAAGRVQRY